MLETLRAGDSPVNKAWTNKDPVLFCVRNMVLNGWSSQVSTDAAFHLYKQRELELSVQDGCREGGCGANPARCPPGITRIKGLARSFVWGPGIDKDLERKVKMCQDNGKAPAVAPLHPWEWPARPWFVSMWTLQVRLWVKCFWFL